jgi:1-acyl-sn-glycerol-3-phosphate acyltransferase
MAAPVCRRLFRLRIEGYEHVPAAGPAIIAANHLSFFDSVALTVAITRPLRFVGKAEYLDSWKTRRLLPALGMIPVDRDNARRAYGALKVAADVLEADELFAVYPEGTRSTDGGLRDGHNGVGHLSVTTGASIIPTGIVGTDRIQPRGARWPRPFRSAVVRFGSPINPDGYVGSRRDRRRSITRDVMSAIGQLSGQAYTIGVAP